MKKRFLTYFLVAIPILTWAGDNDDFGTWLELGATKSITQDFSLGIEGELRTEDNSKKMDRLSIGFGGSYKMHKYLKIGASYNFMASYTGDKTSKETFNGEGELIGWRYTPSYWTPKHRFCIEASSSVKLWKWLRIGVRERYQFTHKAEKTVTGRYDTEYDAESNTWSHDPAKAKTYDCETGQYIRSRIKLEVDKKHLDWSPFISVEFHNSIENSFHLHKLRTSLGTEYKINRHHSASIDYILTNEFDESPNERMHALSLGYNYKF